MQHRSTLVFVNTRRWPSALAMHLGERIGEDLVAAHHGSLVAQAAPDRRTQAQERRDSPAGGDRIARTGYRHRHRRSGLPDQLAALDRRRPAARRPRRPLARRHPQGPHLRHHARRTAGMRRHRSRHHARAISMSCTFPHAPLDILAQQIVAMCACEDWDEDELFDFMRRAYPYRDLKREDYDRILEMLSQGIAAKRGRYGAYLFRDMVNRRLRARRGAAWPPSPAAAPFPKLRCSPWWPAGGHRRRHASTRTSPSRAMPATSCCSATPPGAFAASSRTPAACWWKMRTAPPPTVPFWRGEAPARTDELSLHVADLREQISKLLPNTAPLPVPLKPGAWAKCAPSESATSKDASTATRQSSW